MASRPHRSGGTLEAQPPALYSNYFDCDTPNEVPIDPYFGQFGNRYTPPMFDNHDGYNTPFHTDNWPRESVTGPEHLTGAAHSPSAPMQCFPNPLPAFDGILPTDSTAWPNDGTQWWSQMGSLRNNISVTSADGWEADVPSVQGHDDAHVSLTSPATDTRKRKFDPEPLPHSLPQARRKPRTSDSTKGDLESAASGPVIELTNTNNIRLSKNSIFAASDDSFDPTRTEVNTTRRRSETSRRKSSAVDIQPQFSQSPSSPPQVKQRARNRSAATKCRARTKAATAELEAMEKAESLRHQQLMASFRSLQAQVFALKNELLLHGNCHDNLIQDYLKKTARSLTVGSSGGAI